MKTRLCLLGLLVAPWVLYGQGQPPITCGDLTTCAEVASFVSAITDFRAIVQNTPNRILTTRISFRNKQGRPLILGYVQGSGVATDDRGNRYVVYGAQAVRGIGEIVGAAGDSKFLLQPGEASDARFEFLWRSSGTEIYGLTYEIDLTIREIEALPGNQFRLGREHALHFSGLGNQAAPSAPARPGAAPVVSSAIPPAAAPQAGTAAPAAGMAAAAPPVPAAPPADVCGGKNTCYSAGPFVAEVTGITPSQVGAYHVLDVRVRFRSRTNQPVILGYVARSAVITDNLGNRYASKDEGVRGIGLVAGGQADTQFALNPGASGNTTFQLVRYRTANDPVGASYNFDVTIAQHEIVQAQIVRTMREYSVGFTDMGVSAMSSVVAPAASGVNDSVRKLGDIFRGKKK